MLPLLLRDGLLLPSVATTMAFCMACAALLPAWAEASEEALQLGAFLAAVRKHLPYLKPALLPHGIRCLVSGTCPGSQEGSMRQCRPLGLRACL